jgi:hypothetical protein
MIGIQSTESDAISSVNYIFYYVHYTGPGKETNNEMNGQYQLDTQNIWVPQKARNILTI